MAIVPDEWLSVQLGRPVFSVGVPDVHEVAAHAAGRPGAIYQARVPAEEIEAVRALGAAGFYVVNATLTMARAPEPLEQEDRWEVREATSADGATLESIAGRCFRHDRFHLDPAIPDDAADRVKREWVANSVRGARGDRVLAAVRDGRAAGFLVEISNGDERVVDLMGVDPERRGEGAGRALLLRFVSDAAGCARVSAGTQAANVAAGRMYESAGFGLAGTAYDMHMHA